MRILGIDPSLSAFGWCVLEGEDGWEIRDWGVIRHPSVKKGEDPGPRLEYFHWRINEIRMRNRPDLVAIEGDIGGVLNPSTTIALAQLGGVLRLQLQMASIRWVEWKPSEWKKHLFGEGSGNIKKDEVQRRIQEEWGLDVHDLDLAEALCIAVATWLETHGRPRVARRILRKR